MRKAFWFDGKCSSDFGLMLSGSGTYDAPERDIEKISVQGRNGDLLIDNGRFKNIPVFFPVSIAKDFAKHADAARSWLLAKPGYRRLEDDYHPGYFRLASFTGPINFDVKFLNRAAEATFTFDCKPQRFLRAGEHPIAFNSAGSLHNPTGFPALPLIHVYGTGSGMLRIGDTVVAVQLPDECIILDSDTQNAYTLVNGSTKENRNSCIKAPEFPILKAGENSISWTGGIAGITITPRWWTV